MTQALRLFDYGPSPNCFKVRLVLRELEIDYERVPVDIFGGATLNAEYGKRNPALSTPVLELPTGEFLPESNAILLHLSEGSHLLPDDPVARAQVYRWLMFEQANLFAILGSLRFRILTGRLDPDSAEAQKLVRLAGLSAGVVNNHLDGREFAVGGEYSVADIALYGFLNVAHEAGVDMAPLANIARWLDTVRAQPRHEDDLPPYPANAQAGAGQSIYDLMGF